MGKNGELVSIHIKAQQKRVGTYRTLPLETHAFGIVSGSVRIGDGTGKGYKLEDSESLFSRYLPSEASQASQPA